MDAKSRLTLLPMSCQLIPNRLRIASASHPCDYAEHLALN